jgi:hypothetical protein
MSNRTIPLYDLSGSVRDFNAATKEGYFLLTRGGKPIAYVLPTRFYDEEGIGYMTDPAFWKMIRQRREEGDRAIPFEEVKAQLDRVAPKRHSNSKSKNGKKGKRNGSARD